MEQTIAVQKSSDSGFARATSIVLLISGAFALIAAAAGLYSHWIVQKTAESVATTTPLPILFYATWGTAVLGLAGTVITLFVQGYRARWFWRCLCGAAILWALLPPVGTVVGVVTLILLLATRSKFPIQGSANAPV
jgi:hypothetical protein